jgi:hypothetical protein
VAGLALLCASISSTVPLSAVSTHDTDIREIVVKGADWANGVTASVHDFVIVAPPARYEEWRVRVANGDVVRLVTAGDLIRRPGAAGWRFEAVGHGQTTVEFVAIVTSGEKSSVPNEPHFTLRVTVR